MARTTLVAYTIISSRVMGRVVLWPCITLAAESPTSTTSILVLSMSEAIE